MLKTIFNTLLDFIFPVYCCICKKNGNILCDKCLSNFKIHNTFFCQRCMTPIINNTHNNCNIKFFDGNGIAFIVLKHNKSISKLISTFKYKFNFSLKYKIQQIIHKYITENNICIQKNTVISYVPITKRRVFWRGFNQSYHIANILSNIINVPVVDLLVKKVNTKSQAKLTKKEREKNLQGAFQFINIDYLDDIDDIILVDDIITTGSTIKECINTIKKIKPQIKIHIFTLSHGTR